MFKSSIFTIFLLATSASIFGQTKAIAFKSHSGNSSNYSTKGHENFGNICPTPKLIAPTLDSIVKINDSTIVQYYNFEDGNFSHDTIMYHPFWSQTHLNIDSLKATSHKNVKFVGFKPSPKSEPLGNLAKPKDEKRRKSIKALNMSCHKPAEN